MYSVDEELPSHIHAFANDNTNYNVNGGVLNCGGTYGVDYVNGSGSGAYNINQYSTDVPSSEIYVGEHVIPYSLMVLFYLKY